MTSVTKQYGITLLELLLVLAIAATVTVLGFRFYQSLALNANIEQVKSSVELLFSGVANYYQSVCKNNTILPGTSTTPKVINISTDMTGFIDPALINNPLIDQTSTPTSMKGYYIQLNPITNSMRTYACWNFGSSTTSVTCSNNPQPSAPSPQVIPSKQAIIWKAQVAVKLANTLNADTYKNLMGADCTSTIAAGGGVAPCSANTPGQYLVWERLPSLASPQTNAGSWGYKPVLKQFNLQYTHDQMLELSGSTAAGGDQYYQCGG